MNYLKLLCMISIYFFLFGCSIGSTNEVEIYTIGNDTEPIQIIKEEDVVRQIKLLTNHLSEVPIEVANSNGYKGKPDAIFKVNGSKWFVYYDYQKTIIRKNEDTFYQATNEQASKFKKLFEEHISGKE
ncbi:hypothetical protein [Guptibacillus spartinae]|uniref:hypothetical protein n=1 Tax=Guptibacillus spartinae TaxID=3025679 RepID=UPI00235F4F33|nr:hypothetical protein [Pseudalkalibacillus spartinae]